MDITEMLMAIVIKTVLDKDMGMKRELSESEKELDRQWMEFRVELRKLLEIGEMPTEAEFAALPEEGRIAVLRRESAFGKICERAFLLKKRLGPFEGLR